MFEAITIIQDFLSNSPIAIVFACSLVVELFLLLVSVSIYQQVKRLDLTSIGSKSLPKAILGLSLLPLGVLIDIFLWFVNLESLNQLNRLIIIFEILAGVLIFTTFYTSYLLNVVNVSPFMRKLYRLMATVISSLILVSVGVVLLLVAGIIELWYYFIACLSCLGLIILVLVITMAISVIDFLRISNKLVKVRLGLTTVSGGFFLLQSVFNGLWMQLSASSGEFYNIGTILFITASIPIVLCLYWSFFIPVRIQEWTGILPPSFKELRAKQQLLAQMHQTSQLTPTD
ncbi:MAG: hypothetical protein ACFFBD_15745 [Candidatus Hodarchaeota archaeon]